MPNPNDLLKMPVKVQPYEHQKRAFAFAMRMFGVFEECGDDSAHYDKGAQSQNTRFPKEKGW